MYKPTHFFLAIDLYKYVNVVCHLTETQYPDTVPPGGTGEGSRAPNKKSSTRLQFFDKYAGLPPHRNKPFPSFLEQYLMSEVSKKQRNPKMDLSSGGNLADTQHSTTINPTFTKGS